MIRNEIAVDKQGRVRIPIELVELTGLRNYNKPLAVCSSEVFEGIFLRKIDEDSLKDCKIISTIKLDEKNRIFINKVFSQITRLEVFVLNGDLCLAIIDNS